MKTRYQITVDADKLIADVLAALDRLRIAPPRIVAEKGPSKAAVAYQLLRPPKVACLDAVTLGDAKVGPIGGVGGPRAGQRPHPLRLEAPSAALVGAGTVTLQNCENRESGVSLW